MLIPDHVFFWHLANRRFPAGNFIRSPRDIRLHPGPDVFHDVFGHVPLLTDPCSPNYMHEYGKAGWKAMRYNRLKALGALYWYTVEFGLIQEPERLRSTAPASCRGPREAVFALGAQSPNRIMLNVDRVMRTDYVIDDLQPSYFVIESFADLYHQTVERDFDRLYRSLGAGFTYANSAVIDIDDVLHRGTQEYHLRGGRGSDAQPGVEDRRTGPGVAARAGSSQSGKLTRACRCRSCRPHLQAASAVSSACSRMASA
jgi:phenylalanine-4-hydroxylase